MQKKHGFTSVKIALRSLQAYLSLLLEYRLLWREEYHECQFYLFLWHVITRTIFLLHWLWFLLYSKQPLEFVEHWL